MISKSLTFIGNFLKRTSALGCYETAKLIAACHCKGMFRITPSRAAKAPLLVRGRTSDPVTVANIFVDGDYLADLPSTPTRIIDAGANIGASAVYFALKYPQAEILALEPELTNFQLLKVNSAPYPNIRPIHAALWWEEGFMQCSPQWNEKDSFKFSQCSANVENAVQSLSVASLVKDGIDLLKIDIEGAEGAIFSHGCDWLKNVKYMFLELHNRSWKPVFDSMKDQPYDCRLIGHNILFLLESTDAAKSSDKVNQ